MIRIDSPVYNHAARRLLHDSIHVRVPSATARLIEERNHQLDGLDHRDDRRSDPVLQMTSDLREELIWCIERSFNGRGYMAINKQDLSGTTPDPNQPTSGPCECNPR